ncbi:NHL repeat-containing protein [Pseudocnuella soli]|uniref:ATP-binding protein n=1 Tax=Pseudocnuella soli TaxID=2502779 RepID=UPI0010468F54|nr:ATP-binding protein [Pseudocnuella soli]
MKQLMLLLALGLYTAAGAQRSLEKLWESDTTLAVPESVLPDPQKNILYVSLIDGEPWGADGKGAIAQLDKSGKILNAAWVTGLHAPKGMGLHGGKLYVADMGEVVVIDVQKGAIEKRIPITDATGLNDITIGNGGTVYVSDSRNGKVHRISNGNATLYMDGLKGVNGVLAVGNELYVCTSNDVLKTTDGKQTTVVGTMPMGGDGIEPIGNGDLITSTWSGVVYYITKDGQVSTLLDTREQKKNTADIGYDAQKRIVYVPTFFAKSVVAYQLK